MINHIHIHTVFMQDKSFYKGITRLSDLNTSKYILIGIQFQRREQLFKK